jgi:hypothetical protein
MYRDLGEWSTQTTGNCSSQKLGARPRLCSSAVSNAVETPTPTDCADAMPDGGSQSTSCPLLEILLPTLSADVAAAWFY